MDYYDIVLETRTCCVSVQI